MSPSVFKHIALVLVATTTGTRLGATKTGLAVTDLFDDTSTPVNLAGLNWSNTVYPGTPDMYFFPLIHAIPPSYMAHDNQSVTVPFPTDQGDEETWAIQALIREALSYAHTNAA